MYTLLSTFPLHDTPAGHQDSRTPGNKFKGNASTVRDSVSRRLLQVRRKPKDSGRA
jgi:hypothetical protein